MNQLFGDFEGKLTREKWMKLTKISSRTALRDIEGLIQLGVLEQEEVGGEKHVVSVEEMIHKSGYGRWWNPTYRKARCVGHPS